MKLATAKAVITGGASGLGYASAEKVIAAGGQVVIFDVNDEQGIAAADKLGSKAHFVLTDVASEDNVKASVADAAAGMGGITLAVNCAGIATAGRALGPRRAVAHRHLQPRDSDQPGRHIQCHQGNRGSHGTK